MIHFDVDEAVFRALADPSRRLLLDQLFERDGQTLTELEQHLAMTRFGVMKHLRLLEAANLITTRRVGREKWHYLNPVPIQLIYQRWVSKYARPFAETLGGLKAQLERDDMEPPPKHVFQIYIRTSAARLWDAITNGDITRRYFHSTAVESDWQPGSPVVYRYVEEEGLAAEGTVLAVDPPNRLSYTFRPLWNASMAAERPARMTWEIVELDDVCKVTVTHDDFDGFTQVYETVGQGWPAILSSLKSLIETGEALSVT